MPAGLSDTISLWSVDTSGGRYAVIYAAATIVGIVTGYIVFGAVAG